MAGRGATNVTEQHQPHGFSARGVAGAENTSAVRSGADVARADTTVRDLPQATVTRLATYLRVLGVMADDGTLIVSSEELATAAGVGSAKLRKDLSFLGPNGVRGVGYDVTKLRARIEAALGLDRGHQVVLVGVGSLGQALARYGGFGRRGFTMVGLFDRNPDRIGSTVDALTVRDVAELEAACRELDATIGVIATPDESAQEVCDLLVNAGVRCILSFAASPLDVPKHVEIRRVDLAVEMQVLSFHSARNAETEPAAASAAVGLRTARSASSGSGSTTNGSVMAP
ncbi:redox-sensing transcriptional repressor Rex [Rhodococcus oryzae]|uniref:Redox-sensing transcriptional repressor Rex n=1 Tax=Rhodococcus oryzae TaxID=2571143 RepID=A0ABY2RMJ3_9NOCA|nr:redox-sensing transcriptional repressor Rex [Rhodococcus oryzae]